MIPPIEFRPGTPAVIAGPCSAESREQVLDTALALDRQGISVFRAGLWKPRTHPGGFEGVGEAGLDWLAEVRERTAMQVATEVATPAHVRAAADAGIDILWIGARTSANPFAVQEIADTLATMPRKPAILIKNPVSPDLELWIGAIQRIAEAGVDRLGAIHRGFSTYGERHYRNRPYWAIPFELRRRIPQLTLICDPSHIAGRRELVGEVASKAMAMNFDGLIIETHICPECALSDAAQQLTPDELALLISRLPARGGESGGAEIEALREQIDRLDDNLLETLAQRMKLTDRIGHIKHSLAIPAVQPLRYSSMMHQRLLSANRLELNEDFIRRLLSAIHEESVRRQVEIIQNMDEEG